MTNQTCFTAPTAVPVEEMTQVASDWFPPLGTCNELPVGQVIGVADEDLAPARAPVTLTNKKAAIPTAASTAPARKPRPLVPPEILIAEGLLAADRRQVRPKYHLSDQVMNSSMT